MIARFAIVSWTLGALLSLQGCLGPTERQSFPEKPNFLIIITDDQRWDTMGDFMPITQARIFDEGVYFKNAYVTTPLCCPSRASILTGMYAHNHGVRRNDDPLLEPTFVERLHEAGYFTGLVGKHLNSWDGSARPEFDFWVSLAGEQSSNPMGVQYIDPVLNVDGLWDEEKGYITHILNGYVFRFLEEALNRDNPFLLIFAPNAPHYPSLPATEHKALYPDLPSYRPPNFNEEDTSDKPQWLQRISLLTSKQMESIDTFRRQQLQALKAVDQALGEILALLEVSGNLDNTVIFYISDNGYFWGEHRLVGHTVGQEGGRTGKNLPYEPAIRVPFALRYPRLVPTGRIDEHLVANIDIAPTIYELAGLPVPAQVDGLSLVSLLQGKEQWRDDLFIEGWGRRRSWVAVHIPRYVYVETEGDLAELYDLEADPYQLQNRAYDPEYADLVAEMQKRLHDLRQE